MYSISLCIHINKSKFRLKEMTLCWASNKYLDHHSFFLFRSSISKVYYNLDTQFAGLIFLAFFVRKMEVTQTFSFIKNLAPDIWPYVGYYLYIIIACYSWLKDALLRKQDNLRKTFVLIQERRYLLRAVDIWRNSNTLYKKFEENVFVSL